jgi:16S rRNA (guanine966-N2)-methyltransferase
MAKQNKKSPQGRLRIVAGIWRSRLLEIADVEGLRPTSERVRETLFNWMTPHVRGARCLDLCAGTGALGIEALSRGASQVVFVEKEPCAVAMLRSNIASLNTIAAEIHPVDARRYLENADTGRFDIVFLDPPFAEDMLDELCRLLLEYGMLATDARIYLELDRQKPQPELPQGWRALKNKTAGNVRYMLATPAN